MTRDEYVRICKTCSNRKFDPRQGVVCKLTNEIASFNGQCGSFILDSVSQKQEESYASHEIVDNHSTKGAGVGLMIIGAVLCGGGIVATVANFGFIFYGAILGGGGMFIRGLIAATDSK